MFKDLRSEIPIFARHRGERIPADFVVGLFLAGPCRCLQQNDTHKSESDLNQPERRIVEESNIGEFRYSLRFTRAVPQLTDQ